MDNLIGKKLDGRYQLEELIGSGDRYDELFEFHDCLN